MKKYALLLLLMSLLATFANAQFPIRIPKIKIPKIETPKTESKPQPSRSIQSTPTNQPRQPVVTPSNATGDGRANYGDSAIIGKPQNRQMVIDDSVTVFVADAFEKRDDKLGYYVTAGWYLTANLRILGTFANRSAFRILVKKNGRELSNVRCEGKVYRKADDSKYDKGVRRKGKDMNFEDFMLSWGCFDKKQAIDEIGNLDVEAYFIDGDTDAETLVRKYVIDVREATKVDGVGAKSHKAVSDYYIQRHAEASVAFAYLSSAFAYSREADVGYLSRPLSGVDSAQVEVYTSMSVDEVALTEFIKKMARCSVNGQRITFPRNQVSVSRANLAAATYSDRKAAKYHRGVEYEENIRFSRVLFSLPIYSGKTPITNAVRLEDHIGKWECEVRSNGITLRTFRWEVGSDGRIVSHPEQQNGNVNLFYNANLIEMEIPSGGSVLDLRLLPLPNAGFFYGIPWTSAEGKAAAARVPTKGNPYPVPSDKQK